MTVIYRESDLQEKEKEELLEIANEQLGMSVPKTYGKDRLISLIINKMNNAKKAEKYVFNGFPDENGVFKVPPGGGVVEIGTNAFNPYKRPIPIGVNGKFIYAPVERPIVLEKKHIEVLKNARRWEVTQKGKDQDGKPIDHYTERSSYPFNVMFMNNSDEVVEYTL